MEALDEIIDVDVGESDRFGKGAQHGGLGRRPGEGLRARTGWGLGDRRQAGACWRMGWWLGRHQAGRP